MVRVEFGRPDLFHQVCDETIVKSFPDGKMAVAHWGVSSILWLTEVWPGFDQSCRYRCRWHISLANSVLSRH